MLPMHSFFYKDRIGFTQQRVTASRFSNNSLHYSKNYVVVGDNFNSGAYSDRTFFNISIYYINILLLHEIVFTQILSYTIENNE